MAKGIFFPYKDENVAKSRPYLTITLIALNVAVFFWSITDYEHIIGTYGFTPALFVLSTLFTSMFLHGGLEHLFGNMWYLYLFGDNVEDRFGKFYFILFYLASGLAATLVHYLTDPSSLIPTIGASGAISGVLGAYLVFYPHARIHVFSYYYQGTVPAWMMIGFWFGLQLIFGTIVLVSNAAAGIAFWAHIGGFVFGAAVAWLYQFTQKPQRRR